MQQLVRESGVSHQTRAEQSVDLTRRIVDEIINAGDIGLADEIFAPEFVNHSPRFGAAPDRVGFKQYIADVRAAFPDLHMQIEDVVAVDDKVVIRFTTRGTQLGTFAGIPPSGRSLRASGFTLLRMRDGRVVERWNEQNDLETMLSLGAILTLPQAA